MRSHAISGLCALLLVLNCVGAITRDDLYTHGRGLDRQLPPDDESSSEEIQLNVPIVFYGQSYSSIYVNMNGLLSFRTDIPSFINTEFPLEYPIIAPFYTNVDTRGSGVVYFRETQDAYIIAKATAEIQQYYPDHSYFEPTSVFLVTWVDVGYHSMGINKTNTYQVAIISNGLDSFVEFLYPENGIQWIQGAPQVAGLPDARAQAGFVSEDGRYLLLKNSGTDRIRLISQFSNAGTEGLVIFRVGNIPSGANIEQPEQYKLPDDIKNVPETCSEGGAHQCHIKAQCIDYSSGFCCACLPGFYGNGNSCLKNDVPLRVNGKVTGELNGQLLEPMDLQAYVVMSDGRSYTALSKVPDRFGYDMQTLNILGGVIGWLFAKPIGDAKNGYQLTGGVFNHTTDILFNDSGHKVKIIQYFTGLDVFDQLRMEVEIKGSIPNLPPVTKLDIHDYEEQYSSTTLGHILSQSSRSFKNRGLLLEYPFRIEQAIEYNTCKHAPPEEANVNTYTLKVAKNFIGYESREHILRYGMSNKITPLGQEDPCIKGRETCVAQSSCVTEGDNFKCVCNPGYHYIYPNDSPAICVDINECSTGTHNCDVNAQCVNHEGSFSCYCSDGYEGNGIECNKISVCKKHRCDLNARCHESNGRPFCLCNSGYTGDGNRCFSLSDAGCNIAKNCSQFANCVMSRNTHKYECVCLSGYTGDGYTCSPEDEEYEYTTPYYGGSENERENNPEHEYGRQGGEYEQTGGEYGQTEGEHGQNGGDDGQNRGDYGQNGGEYGQNGGEYGQNGSEYGQNRDGYGQEQAEIIDAKCILSECWCPSGYELSSDKRCYRIEDYDTTSSNIEKENSNVPLQYPLPFCFNGSCSCVQTHRYDEQSHTCFPKPHLNLFTKGGPYYSALSCNVVNRCHPYAQCVLLPSTGEYQCQCTAGYEGNGVECNEVDVSCEELDICDPHATCTFDPSVTKHICVCNTGYVGDGNICHSRDTCISTADCEENAECTYTTDGEYTRKQCVCIQGYAKDHNDACVPDGGSHCNGAKCAENATCQWDSVYQVHYCECDSGFEGNGVDICTPVSKGCNIVNDCGLNAYCQQDPISLTYHCTCNPGFYGDGYICTSQETCQYNPSMCSKDASCVEHHNEYVCKCKPGFVGNGRACEVAPKHEGNFLLLNQGMATLRVPFQPTSKDPGRPIYISYYQMAIGLDVDCTHGRVYWSDITGRAIKSCNYDGSSPDTFLSNDIVSPEGISIDWVSRNIYWTDSRRDTIEVANLETKLRKVLVNTSLVDPRGIAVHPGRGKIFWSDWNRESPKIEWANMDGTGRGIFLKGDSVHLPNSLAIDWYTDNLCYADAGTKSIECVSIDDREKYTVATNCSYPFGLAITNTHFYWTDWVTQKIESVDRRTNERQKSLDVPLGSGSGNKLYGMAAVSSHCMHLTNHCQYENGGCPPGYLCLLDGKGGKRCVCGMSPSGSSSCNE